MRVKEWWLVYWPTWGWWVCKYMLMYIPLLSICWMLFILPYLSRKLIRVFVGSGVIQGILSVMLLSLVWYLGWSSFLILILVSYIVFTNIVLPFLFQFSLVLSASGICITISGIYIIPMNEFVSHIVFLCYKFCLLHHLLVHFRFSITVLVHDCPVVVYY